MCLGCRGRGHVDLSRNSVAGSVVGSMITESAEARLITKKGLSLADAIAKARIMSGLQHARKGHRERIILTRFVFRKLEI